MSALITSYAHLARRLGDIGRLLLEQSEHATGEVAQELRGYGNRLAEMAAEARAHRRLDPLPPGQARVLVFIRQFIAARHFSPSRKEIADGLGVTSANGIQEHLVALEAKGVLTLLPFTARGIRLNKRSAT